MRKLIMMLPAVLLLAACGGTAQIERPNVVGGVDRTDYLEARAEGDVEAVAAMEAKMQVYGHANADFDNFALRSGETIAIGSGRNQIVVTCGAGRMLVSVGSRIHPELRQLAGMQLTTSDYHCSPYNVGQTLLARVEGSDSNATTLLKGILGIAQSATSGMLRPVPNGGDTTITVGGATAANVTDVESGSVASSETTISGSGSCGQPVCAGHGM